MFQHLNIHKYSWTSPDGKTHNQMDQILIVWGWHSSMLVRYSVDLTVILITVSDCDTNHWWLQKLGKDWQ